MIRLNKLSKSYGKNQVLKDLNLTFNSSGITAVLGPNGSGKTTLLKCFLGMVIPDEGDVLFEDQSIKNRFAYRQKVSHVPQIAHFPENLTALELIKMIKDIRTGVTRERELIQLFDLKKELEKKMNNLSGGNLQKVNLLLGLMYDCPLIVLDEPSTGLDPLSLQNLKRWLRREKETGKLILITTHIMSFVEEVADHIIFLLDGKIYFKGNLEDLLAQEGQDQLEKAIANILRKS